MAQHANCTRCSFEFHGGHSHHTGSSCALCVSCLAAYSLTTENPWGPAVGERLHLLLGGTATRRKKRKRNRLVDRVYHDPPLDTGVYITTLAGETKTAGEDEFTDVIYPIENVACPQCSKMTVVLGFDADDQCPECGEQSLELHAIIY